ENSHFVPAPTSNGATPAVTVQQAIGDLAPVCRKSWTAKSGKPLRKMEETAGYRRGTSAYALAMRNWCGFETNGAVTGHVVRHTPRDYAHFATMKHGE